MSATTGELDMLADRIQHFDFDHCFTLHADGSIDEPSGVWAPNVYHDPTGDVEIEDPAWSCVVGLTGQDSYHGACMHASEYVGRGVAEYMLDMCQDDPVTFALVVVYVLPEDDDDESDDVAGWAIAYKR